MNLAQAALVIVCFTFDIHRAVAEDVFIVTNNYCITNSTSAITFNSDVEKTDPSKQPVSSFYPTIGDDNSQCDYEDECKYQRAWMGDSDWSVINSLDGPINHIITDRRWEAFRLYKTFLAETYLVSNIKYGHSFEISVSIRAQQEGHIFLCDGTKPTNSSCYWILIGYGNGNTSGIRKCATNNINVNFVPKSRTLCKPLLKEKDTPAVLSEKFWTHFKISKQGNQLVVWKGNEQLLYFDDTRDIITPNSLIIHSKKVEALWKIHDYHYLYTVTEGVTSLGPPGFLKSQSCISMYIAMCKECSLTVRIALLNEDLAKETFTTQNTEWKKIHMRFTMITDEAPILYISRKIESERNGFWAIDDIRFCSENDYRFIKSSEENVPCEKIDIRRGQILNVKTEKVDVSNKPNINCPEETFGKFCVPCKIFDNKRPYCKGFKYCENGDQETECRCTSGYMDQCEKDCPRDMFGHGCKKICGSCERYCNNVNGYCTPCLNSYEGSRCDIAPEPLLKDPPKVTFDGIWCKVQVENFETTTGERAKYFFIQYRSENDNNWKNITDKLKAFYDQSEDLIHCNPDTTYEFRAVLMAESNSSIPPEVNRKSRTIKTPCKGLEPDDIIIEITNTTAKVTFKREKFNCRLARYNCILSNGVTKRASENVEFNDLEPYKSYNISCSDYKKNDGALKNFQTKEGVPSEVQNLTGTVGSTKILLTWQEPLKTNGIIHHYDITYKLGQNKGWNKLIDINQTIEIRSSETTTTINNLCPFSTYYVAVRAVTGAGPGEYSYATVETTMSAFSRVRNLTQTVYPRKILLSWQPPLEINGTIDSYETTYRLVQRRGCKNSNDRNDSTTMSFLETAIELNNLYPYSIYEVSVRAMARPDPGEYTNITVETAISDELSQSERMTIKLLSPLVNKAFVYLNQTPCNELEGPVYIRFKVSCSNEWCSKSTEMYTLSVDCVRLKNLFPFSQYTLIMEVSRDNKTKWIETSSKTFSTEQTSPGPIASKAAIYTRDDHSVSLRWKPPYPPTGILKQYQLVYTEQRHLREFRETVNAETCKIWSDYHCATITRGIEIGTTYNLQIYARNEYYEKFQSVSDEFSIINTGIDSDPVYGLEGVWIKNSGLKVSWYHPNNTNGELQEFGILIPLIYNERISINSNNYSLTYTHTIPETNFKTCLEYRIFVSPFNEHRGTEVAYQFLLISTPPRISINNSELLDSIKSSRYTITVAIPLLAQEKGIEKKIYILISDSAIINVLDDFEKSVQNGQEDISIIRLQLVFESTRTNLFNYFEIGNVNSSAEHNQIYRNPPLHPGKNYCVTYLFVYKCNSATTERVQKCINTKDDNVVSDNPSTAGLNTLLLILFATILGLA